MIFAASCTRNTQSQNNVCTPIVCRPVYGRKTDWDVISDELARNIYRHNMLCKELSAGVDMR